MSQASRRRLGQAAPSRPRIGSIEFGPVLPFRPTPYAAGSGSVPDGNADGQIPLWNATSGAWVPTTPDPAVAADIPFTPPAGWTATDVEAAVEQAPTHATGAPGGLVIPAPAAVVGQKSVTDASTPASGGNLTPVAGRVYLARLFDTPAATFSAISVFINTVGVNGAAVMANAFVGLYYLSGANLALAGASADRSSSWSSGAVGQRANIALTEQSAGSLTNGAAPRSRCSSGCLSARSPRRR